MEQFNIMNFMMCIDRLHVDVGLTKRPIAGIAEYTQISEDLSKRVLRSFRFCAKVKTRPALPQRVRLVCPKGSVMCERVLQYRGEAHVLKSKECALDR